MKKLFSVLLCVLLLNFTGCETLKKIYNVGTGSVSVQTADQLIVSAELATQIGQDVMNSFIHQERDHRELFAKLGSKPREYSIWLRVRVPDPYVDAAGLVPRKVARGVAILETARIATKAFKANRTPENEANLRTAWASLQSVITSCKSFTAAAYGR